jgi:hypothetical protein
MKKQVYLLAFLTIVLATFSAFQPKPVKGKTRSKKRDTVVLSNMDYDILWGPTSFDFGKIEKDVKVRHKFTLTNMGRKPFIINKASWGYSGMLVTHSPEPILPGQSSDILVVFGAFNEGVFSKSITVQTTGGTYELMIKGEVFEPVKWKKVSHDFGEVKQGEQLETTFICRNGSDTLVLENVMASCGCISPGWKRAPIPPHDSTEIKVIFDTKGKSGKHTKYISVYTNRGLYELSVKANIVK